MSGEGGIQSAPILQVLFLLGLARQRLSRQRFAFTWLMLVVYGCLGAFGIGFSTVSVQSTPAPSESCPAPSADPQDLRPRSRRRRRKTADSSGDGENSELQAGSYARFSSDLQRDASIDDQRRKCREAAQRNGHQILADLEFSDEAVSGTKLKRDGLDAMLRAAERGDLQVLYLFSLSRLARESVLTMPMLKRLVHTYGVRVICVSEGLDSERDGWELMASTLSVLHEMYIKDLSENVLRGQEGTVLGGFSVGDWCFGFRSEPLPGTEAQRRGRNARPRMVYAVDLEQAEWVQKIVTVHGMRTGSSPF